MAITEIASLADVKNYLRIPLTDVTNDWVLSDLFMPAAQKAIERELGHIVAKDVFAERHNGGGCDVWLRELPVLYVRRVEEGWGSFVYELVEQPVNTPVAMSLYGYSLDNPKGGQVTRRSANNVKIPFRLGDNNIRVDYVVGRKEMPANAVLAFCELTAHWFRSTQQRTGNQASQAFNPNAVVDQDFTRSTGITSINMGVPYAILELLKPDRRRPIIG